MQLESIKWFEAEPERLERELEAMALAAPDLVWCDAAVTLPAGGWEGKVPDWPFNRPRPDPGLRRLLLDDQLAVRIELRQSFPASEPKIWPLLDPPPHPLHRTDPAWHINGDGSLCLLQAADMWTGSDTVADLVAKAAGWFIEYRLLQEGLVEAMTLSGINSDTALDPLIAGFGT